MVQQGIGLFSVEDRDKWRKFAQSAANPRIEEG
jgi:hypothetical protein